MVKKIHQAESAIKAGDTKTGFEILREVLAAKPDSEKAWWIMSGLVQREQRAACLKQVLRINPENQFAREALEGLLSSPPQPGTKKPRKRPPVPPLEKPSAPSLKRARDKGDLKTWGHVTRSRYFFTILGPEHLTTAMTDSTNFASVRTKLKKGKLPDQLLTKMQTISLSSISSINMLRSGFLVYYMDGNRERSLRFNLGSQAVAKKILDVLQERLGSDFELSKKPSTSGLALGISGVLTLGAGILTTYLYWLTQEIVSGRAAARETMGSQFMINLVENLGPDGVILVGAIFLIASFGVSVWLLLRPMTTTSLSRR
jgi:hypothetical protein